MINQEALEVAVCKMVVFATGLPADKVIIGDPDTGAPSGSYCAVRLQNPEVFGHAMKSQTQVAATDRPELMDILDRTATQLTLSFSINFYRNNAMGYAVSLLEAHRRQPVQLIMREAGLGWSRASPVNNLTGLQSASMEERSQLNIYLYAQDVVEDRVQRIYQVEYAVSDESGRTLIQGNVNGLPS
jgi:hypothetical protein